MAVINYQNLPNTSTPLNATNLNSMQVIAETITNTNGTAIKFTNGTMICTYRANKDLYMQTTSSSRTVQGLTIYRSKVFTWTFPEEFVDATGVTVNMLPNTGNTLSIYTCATRGITRSATSTEMYSLNDFLENSAGYNSLVDVSLCAIGRWKS